MLLNSELLATIHFHMQKKKKSSLPASLPCKDRRHLSAVRFRSTCEVVTLAWTTSIDLGMRNAHRIPASSIHRKNDRNT